MRCLPLLLPLAFCLPALAAPPKLLNQGYLADGGGSGLTGAHDLTFSLFDDALASNPALWTETVSTDFSDGSYSVVLGETTSIDQALLDQYPLFLGLSVDGGSDLLPRYEIVSVPYAFLAETSFNVDGGTVNATSITADSLEVDSVTSAQVVVGKTTLDAGGISIDGSTVIDSSGSFLGSPPPPADLGCEDGQFLVWVADSGAWDCGTEIDPALGSSPLGDLDTTDLDRWDEAFGWGDHGAAGYLTTESDPAFSGSSAAVIDDSDIGLWNNTAWDRLPVSDTDPVTTVFSQDLVDSWIAAASTPESDPVFEGSAAYWITGSQIDGWASTTSLVGSKQANWSVAASKTASENGYGHAEWDAAYIATASENEYGHSEWDAAFSATNSPNLYDHVEWDAAFSATNSPNLYDHVEWDAAFSATNSPNLYDHEEWDAAYDWSLGADQRYVRTDSVASLLSLTTTGDVGVGIETPTTRLHVDGAVRLGAGGGCDVDRIGALQWNAADKALQVCADGMEWSTLYRTLPAQTAADALEDCYAIKQVFPHASDGPYYIAPPGAEGAFRVYCDMTTDGGGWTLVGKVRAEAFDQDGGVLDGGDTGWLDGLAFGDTATLAVEDALGLGYATVRFTDFMLQGLTDSDRALGWRMPSESPSLLAAFSSNQQQLASQVLFGSHATLDYRADTENRVDCYPGRGPDAVGPEFYGFNVSSDNSPGVATALVNGYQPTGWCGSLAGWGRNNDSGGYTGGGLGSFCQTRSHQLGRHYWGFGDGCDPAGWNGGAVTNVRSFDPHGFFVRRSPQP